MQERHSLSIVPSITLSLGTGFRYILKFLKHTIGYLRHLQSQAWWCLCMWCIMYSIFTSSRDTTSNWIKTLVKYTVLFVFCPIYCGVTDMWRDIQKMFIRSNLTNILKKYSIPICGIMMTMLLTYHWHIFFITQYELRMWVFEKVLFYEEMMRQNSQTTFCCLNEKNYSGRTKSVSPQRYSNYFQTLKYSDTACHLVISWSKYVCIKCIIYA